MAREPTPLDYLSPHCARATCAWCLERKRRAAERATAERQAVTPAVGPWGYPLGPGGDILGYWPLHGIPKLRQDPLVRFMKPEHPGGPKHRKVFRRHI